MVIVPAETHLEVEAMVSNRDIGFVEVGQDAAIKIDTFNFTRYGLLHGEVLTVSHDTITREKPQERLVDKPQGAETTMLDRTQMQIENKIVNLSPGMAVTVEIKTGSRRIISYLLSPLARYQHDSLRER